jgi:hypothetical protein
MRAEAQRSSRGSTGGVDSGRTSAEVDLQCAREHWATVHLLHWAIDRHGNAVNKVCTCSTCPTGVNMRPWPTRFELQDAGAPDYIPRSEVPAPAEPAQTLTERLEASAPD